MELLLLLLAVIGILGIGFLFGSYAGFNRGLDVGYEMGKSHQLEIDHMRMGRLTRPTTE